jgi:hypothetical protein|tara:strand:+ start:726 stop:833 length:108 start_codon:yes stop_codon:yes gene_type:complete
MVIIADRFLNQLDAEAVIQKKIAIQAHKKLKNILN